MAIRACRGRPAARYSPPSGQHPPTAAITTVAAYASSEWFLLSAFPHPLSFGGLSEAFNDIADVRARRNPDLEVLGIVFTNVDGRATRLKAELDAVVSEAMPGCRFSTVISQAVIIPMLSGKGKTLFQMPKHERIRVARQYKRKRPSGPCGVSGAGG